MCACVKFASNLFCFVVSSLFEFTMNQIPEELELTLKKLCEHLHLFLNRTEISLEIAQQRFEQVYYVLQPWNLSKQSSLDAYDETSCICSTLKTDVSTSVSAENSLLDSISKTLTTAQSLLSKNSTTSKVSIDVNKKVTKTSSTSVKQKLSTTSKSKQTLSTKSSTSQSMNISKDGSSSHNPSCPLFNVDLSLKKLSNLSLSDAISLTKVPSSLSHTLKYSNKFLENFEKDTREIKGVAKLNFLHLLETQNKKSCAKFEAQYSPSEIFMKYLSALYSYRNKENDLKSDCDWVYYTNVKDIESFQMNRSKIITKQSWGVILRYIIEKIVPVLENSDLGIIEKLYVQKMLKTICNFTQSSVPRVPIFKIHQRDD